MSTEIRIPPTERHGSPESHSTVNVTGSALLMGFLAFTAVTALCVSIYAVGRADAAAERARLAERETRIMEADFQYVRAWANARGVYLPANHEEAESNEPSHHHQYRVDTLASAARYGEGRAPEDGVLVRSGPR